MSLVWVRILMPLSINYNISIAPDKLPERLSQTADVNAVYGMKIYLVLSGIWIAGIIVILFFCLFRVLEVGLSASYVSQILRSFIIVIVLNSIFSKKIKEIDK